MEQAGPGAMALELCSAEAYDRSLVQRVPKKITEADFGCGNPSKWAQPGDTVLDLGSGSGKICYILSQIVGATGRVIGVDMNSDMLALSRAHQAEFSDDIGYDNMTFLFARIQDLRTDLEFLDSALARHPAANLAGYLEIERAARQRADEQPLVPDNSVDLIVSNCVINLVRTDDKAGVFHEMFRVLRPGGRIAISDNVSSIDLPDSVKNDPELWATCYGGVFQEQKFYKALEEAGFGGIRIEVRREMPTRSIDDVHFRSVTVTAVKPSSSVRCCAAATGARQIVYRGPWKEVVDERGNRLQRGEVIDATNALWETLSYGVYRDEVLFVGEEPAPRSTGAVPVVKTAAAGTSCCS
jgi:ubiquinone/menaquinone biosynthesis C-methylase UbiE